MERAERIALDYAKEITLAALGNGDRFPGDSGVATADYFETVYKKVLELAKQAVEPQTKEY